MEKLKDKITIIWVKLSVCWRYGHMPWEDGPGFYCRNCGKVSK